MKITTVPTTPFAGQEPGTSGLRKKCKVFQQPHYLENFVQSIFDSLPSDELKGSEIVLAGDGRYFSDIAGMTIIKMAAANGVSTVTVATNYLMSTPGVSAVIRDRKAYGGIIMTASHNPGGPEEDFGVKYNIGNGGAASESITSRIYERSKTIKEYKITELSDIDTSRPGVCKFDGFTVNVIDSVSVHVSLLKEIFDFEALRTFLSRDDVSLLFDAMHGVAGPSARKVFVDELGLPESCLLNGIPQPDFAGGHPDPNLTYAKELVDRMGLGTFVPDHVPEFGAAADGDADRNMILGKAFFVTPSDSVAIIAANAQKSIPYFSNGVKGVARSMPTSQALDRVAENMGIDLYEVPTGWKFFGNLLDAGKISICGEESFGTGSDHIREKDGLWAVLAWLSIWQTANSESESEDLITIESIVKKHWKTFGRNFYTRYDYENVESEGANAMFDHMRKMIKDNSITFSNTNYTIKVADEFSYTDPVDLSVSEKQGLRFLFSDGSRVVFRLSGTGSVGATVRIYIEQYQSDADKIEMDVAVALAPLVEIALEISQIEKFTGRKEPTVIT